MKLFAAALCLLLPASSFAADAAAETPKPAAKGEAKGGVSSDDQKTLYTLGFYLGTKLTPFSLSPAELSHVEKGLRDSVANKKPSVDVNAYGPKINDLAAARTAKKAEGRKKQDQAFADKAAKESGAQKTESGLVYKSLKDGTGKSPTAEDTVKVHYEGTLVDGTVFDSSIKRGEPIEFPLKGVIPCWTEGVQKMKVGGKAKLVCPSGIAYGDEGRPPTIPGGATLVFEVQLLDIVKK